MQLCAVELKFPWLNAYETPVIHASYLHLTSCYFIVNHFLTLTEAYKSKFPQIPTDMLDSQSNVGLNYAAREATTL